MARNDVHSPDPSLSLRLYQDSDDDFHSVLSPTDTTFGRDHKNDTVTTSAPSTAAQCTDSTLSADLEQPAQCETSLDSRAHSRPQSTAFSTFSTETDMDRPSHPVSTLQGAFEESIEESGNDKRASVTATTDNAERRREKLLNDPAWDESWISRWRQRPSATHHPLTKLVAQIIFGMHLLHHRQAKSEEAVAKILQTHVNDFDAFLERTFDDLKLARADVDERVRHLKLPLQHIDVFEVMLNDKRFRTQLLEGNDKIENIVQRSRQGLRVAVADLHIGVAANASLATYLDDVSSSWPTDKHGVAEVFGAMRGNEQGWSTFFGELLGKAKMLDESLTRLSRVVDDMTRLAGAASRRNKRQSCRGLSPAASTSGPTTPQPRSKFSSGLLRSHKGSVSVDKPLPAEPGQRSHRPQHSAPQLRQILQEEGQPRSKSQENSIQQDRTLDVCDDQTGKSDDDEQKTNEVEEKNDADSANPSKQLDSPQAPQPSTSLQVPRHHTSPPSPNLLAPKTPTSAKSASSVRPWPSRPQTAEEGRAPRLQLRPREADARESTASLTAFFQSTRDDDAATPNGSAPRSDRARSPDSKRPTPPSKSTTPIRRSRSFTPIVVRSGPWSNDDQSSSAPETGRGAAVVGKKPVFQRSRSQGTVALLNFASGLPPAGEAHEEEREKGHARGWSSVAKLGGGKSR